MRLLQVAWGEDVAQAEEVGVTRFFYDLCGSEVQKNTGRLQGELGKMKFQVMTAKGNAWNDGCYCHDCIRKAVALTAQTRKPRRAM